MGMGYVKVLVVYNIEVIFFKFQRRIFSQYVVFVIVKCIGFLKVYVDVVRLYGYVEKGYVGRVLVLVVLFVFVKDDRIFSLYLEI